MDKQKEKKTFSWHKIKRSIFLVLLAIYAVVALVNHSSFLRPKSLETAPTNYIEHEMLPLGEDDVLIQKFTAVESRWAGVSFYFENPNHPAATGYITVELYNSDDELLGFSSSTGDMLRNQERRNFPIEATLEKGEEYYFKIICQDLTNEHGVSIGLLPENHNFLGDNSTDMI